MGLYVNLGRTRKISYHIALDPKAAKLLREPALASIKSALKGHVGPNVNPASLVLLLRQNPHIPSEIYPVLSKIDVVGGRRLVPSLVHKSQIFLAQGGVMKYLFKGEEISAICQGSKFEADARGLYLKSTTLREIPASTLSNPIELARWLKTHVEQISGELGLSVSPTYLNETLSANGIVQYDQTTQFMVGGLGIYHLSRTLQQAPIAEIRKKSDPEHIFDFYINLINWLNEKRHNIQQECNAKHLSLGMLVMALVAAQKIDQNKKISFLAGARDYYENSLPLKEGPKTFDTIDQIILFIDERRDRIPKREEEGRISYSYAVDALFVAGRIDIKKSLRYLRQSIGAADYARRNETSIRRQFRNAAKTYLREKQLLRFDPTKQEHSSSWSSSINMEKWLNKDGKPYADRNARAIKYWAKKLYGNEEALKVMKELAAFLTP